MALTKEQAEALAPIVMAAVSKHAQTVIAGLDDDTKKHIHPQALAALGSIAGLKGQFCEAAPVIDAAISDLGWFAKKLLGAAYAFLLSFQEILKQMQAVLCKKA